MKKDFALVLCLCMWKRSIYCRYEYGIQKYGMWENISYLFEQEIQRITAISLSLKFTKAYEDNGVQKIETFKFTGEPRDCHIILRFQIRWFIIVETKTGSIKICGRTSFYFSIPVIVIRSWKSGISIREDWK